MSSSPQELDENGLFPMPDEPLRRLLAQMDEWLGNSEGLMIEDVIEWRNALAAAIGAPKWT